MEFTHFFEQLPDLMTPEDLQKVLHIGRNTVYKLLADGSIRSLKIGGKYRIPKLYLLEFIYPDRKWEKEVS